MYINDYKTYYFMVKATTYAKICLINNFMSVFEGNFET